MRYRARCGIVVVLLGWFAGLVTGQGSAPPRFDDLPRLAKDWPPRWAALVRDIIAAGDDFEKATLDKVDPLLRDPAPTAADYRLAETLLRAVVRHHESVRRKAPGAETALHPLGRQLHERLEAIRREWLLSLQKANESAEALALADQWLPVTTADGPLRSAILQLWLDQGKSALEKSDPQAARGWLNRLEAEFDDPALEGLRKPLRERAERLFKDSEGMPDAGAIRTLEEALALWPGLPDARDRLERRKGTYRTLVVAVPALPEMLSPALASTVVETQARELLFDRLVHAERGAEGVRYRPQLAWEIAGGPLLASLPLRREVFWSNGTRVTAADVRHTAHLMNLPDAMYRCGVWRDYLELPRLEGNPFLVNVPLRQGLFDPLALLGFPIVPQFVRGKQLERADDLDFAKSPIGSGPFQYTGRKAEAGKTHAVFLTNPHDPRGTNRSIREIRMVAYKDPRKDLAKPLPALVLNAPTDHLAALRELGYAEQRLGENPEVHFLAVNHRRPTLASVAVRRAIAYSLDRQDLLNRWFRAGGKEKYHASANGLFPRKSWATCPAPRVPEELFQAEQALSFARQAKKEVGKIEWTLKYPAGDVAVQKACEEIAQTLRNLFQTAGVEIDIAAQGLKPGEFQKALQERTYDLAYTSAAGLDDPVRLAMLFDPQPDATRAGGSNLLGYDRDVRLQELLQTVLKHRQFAVVQGNLHAVHAHLTETMPAIPLWQLETHVLIQPALRMPAPEGSDLFQGVRDWRLEP